MPRMDDALAQFLAARDVPCPGCGYNLRGLTAPRCPECAQELTLRVNLQEPRLAGFIAGLVALAAGTGFSGLLLIYGCVRLLVERGLPAGRAWLHPFLYVTFAGLVIEGACLLAWIALRPRIRRARRAWRVTLIIACWLLTLVNLCCFVGAIR
ncbi:MAG: hypothetical protein CHACPFDD_04040 [Phycisphaerae bacterium]|nr:hypothetical protein [Phycisphaerae bacterium]